MAEKRDSWDAATEPQVPMIILLTSITFLLSAVGGLVTIRSLRRAPVAHEDDSGFHLDS